MLDIETAPHTVFAWGLYDQNISIDQIVAPGYTLCWSAKWYKKPGVMFSSIKKDGPDKMIDAVHKLLDEADAVCHYNGTSFDIPTLNRDFLVRGIKPPAPVHEIDLLMTARRRFRLASNKLHYVARALGLGQKLKHKGMELWKKCMEGDPASWAVMERYNKMDVVLLERVYEALLPWIKNHPNRALYKQSHNLTCNNCGSKNLERRGFSKTKTNTFQRFQCCDCGTWLRDKNAVKSNSAKLVAA